MNCSAFPTQSPEKEKVWKPAKVQFLYRHQNGSYYVRTFASGKEKWTSLRTKMIRMPGNEWAALRRCSAPAAHRAGSR